MNGSSCTTKDLGQLTDNSAEKVEYLLNLDKAIFSLDMQVPDGLGGTEALAERLADPFDLDVTDSLYQELMKDQVRSLLHTLEAREEGIIAMRFGMTDGQEKTLDAIGKFYGVTRERIRQIEVKTMKKLRHPSRSCVLRQYMYDGHDSVLVRATSETDAATEETTEPDWVEFVPKHSVR
jgi:RNA polymerase primary sigma factor